MEDMQRGIYTQKYGTPNTFRHIREIQNLKEEIHEKSPPFPNIISKAMVPVLFN